MAFNSVTIALLEWAPGDCRVIQIQYGELREAGQVPDGAGDCRFLQNYPGHTSISKPSTRNPKPSTIWTWFAPLSPAFERSVSLLIALGLERQQGPSIGRVELTYS